LTIEENLIAFILYTRYETNCYYNPYSSIPDSLKRKLLKKLNGTEGARLL